MKLYDFIKKQNLRLIHLLDLVREEKWTDEEIAQTLKDLYKKYLIVFAYHSNFIDGSVLSWTEKEWKEAQRTGWFGNSLLRSNYRKGIKKKELISMRKIVRLIFKEDPGAHTYRNRFNHGFFRERTPTEIERWKEREQQ